MIKSILLDFTEESYLKKIVFNDPKSDVI